MYFEVLKTSLSKAWKDDTIIKNIVLGVVINEGEAAYGKKYSV